MRQVLSIARKELRAYFLSPVALIFLATFLFVVLFVFFWVKPFFQRNLAGRAAALRVAAGVVGVPRRRADDAALE